MFVVLAALIHLYNREIYLTSE